MGKKLRTYTSEFKNEAIKLALDTSSVGIAAKDLGIPVSTLHAWIKQSHMNPADLKVDNQPNENKINIKILLDKNRELQKRISRLEQEKSILKKAATYFAKEIG
jgi:transposase